MVPACEQAPEALFAEEREGPNCQGNHLARPNKVATCLSAKTDGQNKEIQTKRVVLLNFS